MDRQLITAIITLDLSVAFNTVDHYLLLTVLNKKFGKARDVLNWYKKYLKP